MKWPLAWPRLYMCGRSSDGLNGRLRFVIKDLHVRNQEAESWKWKKSGILASTQAHLIDSESKAQYQHVL
jgi:hypothetical protein